MRQLPPCSRQRQARSSCSQRACRGLATAPAWRLTLALATRALKARQGVFVAASAWRPRHALTCKSGRKVLQSSANAGASLAQLTGPCHQRGQCHMTWLRSSCVDWRVTVVHRVQTNCTAQTLPAQPGDQAKFEVTCADNLVCCHLLASGRHDKPSCQSFEALYAAVLGCNWLQAP